MWFEKLTGFSEESPDHVRSNISVKGNLLTSQVNGKEYICGSLETPSLTELREQVNQTKSLTGKISVSEVVADVQELHTDLSNAGALFQVASQFNLLEMISPSVTPEQGVDRYEYDRTQGPACAIAAGAGTIYRNYFADVKGQTGQTLNNQVDCLADFGATLGNTYEQLWRMSNGYALPSEDGLLKIHDKIKAMSPLEIDELRKLLRIGVQWNTQVTLNECKHTVTQAYCSALPVAYSNHPADQWSEFAQIVLDASYEATFCAGIINAEETGNNKVFLTLVGGGVFGNKTSWIINAIKRSLYLYSEYDIQVKIVSYGASNKEVQELIEGFDS